MATRRAVLAAGVGALLTASACTARTPQESRVRFARISGDVAAPAGDSAAVNLVIVAPTGDPVWAGIHELIVPGGAGDGGDLVLAGGSVPLHPGTADGGLRAGSILLDVPGDVPETVVNTLQLVVSEGERPVSHEIGQWSLRRSETAPRFEVVGGYPASIPRSGRIDIDLQCADDSLADLVGVKTDAPGLSIHGLEIDLDDAGAGRISFTLERDETFDLFAFSPTLILDEGGETVEEALLPILVGYIDLGEEDVHRISSR